jgi:hypothetical protein
LRPSWLTPFTFWAPAKGPYSRTISAARAGASDFLLLAALRLMARLLARHAPIGAVKAI